MGKFILDLRLNILNICDNFVIVESNMTIKEIKKNLILNKF